MACGSNEKWDWLCVVPGGRQAYHLPAYCVRPRGHIVRSLRHVDFFHRSPPGHPTSKLARSRAPTDEQSLLILEKVVGFWVVLCGRQAGRRLEGGEGPGRNHAAPGESPQPGEPGRHCRFSQWPVAERADQLPKMSWISLTTRTDGRGRHQQHQGK